MVKSIDDGGSVYFYGTTVDPFILISPVAGDSVCDDPTGDGDGGKNARNCSTRQCKFDAVVNAVAKIGVGFTKMQSSSPAWVRLAGVAEVRSTEYSSHAGVYQSADRLLAVNRSEAEDDTKLVSDDQLKQLFSGLSFRTVRDEVGTERSLIQEVWRLFLILMLLMLLSESALSLPRTIRSRSQILHARAEG